MLEKILTFLFSPESWLSIMFLAIFTILGLVGIRKASVCKSKILNFEKNAMSEFQLLVKNDTADAFVDNFDRELSADDLLITDWPNVFVSVGIVGTFIGLGIALKDASGLLSSEKLDINQLKSVLDVIAFKFQISVWGTVFSLAFQILVVGPYNAFRDRCLTKVVKDLHLGTYSTAEKHLNIVDELKGSLHSFVVASENFTGNVAILKDFVDGYTSTQDKIALVLGQSISDMSVKATDMVETLSNKNMEMCTDIRNTMVELAGDLDGNFRTYEKGFLRAQTEFVKVQGESFKEFVCDELLNSHREYLNQVSGINQSVEILNSSTVQFMNAVSGLEKKIELVCEITSKQVEKIGEEIKVEQKKFGDTAVKLSDICEAMREVNENTSVQLCEITENVLPNLFRGISPQIIVNELEKIGKDITNNSDVRIVESIKSLEESTKQQSQEDMQILHNSVVRVSDDIRFIAEKVKNIPQCTIGDDYEKMLQNIDQHLTSVNEKLNMLIGTCKLQQD